MTKHQEQLLEKFHNTFNDIYELDDLYCHYGDGAKEPTLEQFLLTSVAEARKTTLEELYEELDFHHIFRSSYSKGSYDDGGHTAIEMVKKRINKLLSDLKQTKGEEEK